jgi:NACHT domain- and WD repeat-containing protein
VAMSIDPVLYDTWYKKDSNAVPPISVLQPISSILINFNNKVSTRTQILDIRFFFNSLLAHVDSESLSYKQKIKLHGGT